MRIKCFKMRQLYANKMFQKMRQLNKMFQKMFKMRQLYANKMFQNETIICE